MTPPAVNSYEAYRLWFDVAQLILTGVIGLYVWLSNRVRINHKRFIDLEKRVGKKITAAEVQDILARELSDCSGHQSQTKKLEQTTASLEAKVQAAPSWDELKSLNLSITSLTEKIATLDGKFGGVNRAVELINEFLINQGAKK